MKLRSEIDMIHFLKAVESCTGDVRFCSPQGDVLNLKSTLSQYLFASLLARKDLLQSGDIVCSRKHDLSQLESYIMEEN